MKFFEVPAQLKENCTDIKLKCIHFALPETLDISENIKSICNIRNFRVIVIANYIDTDYKCCN